MTQDVVRYVKMVPGDDVEVDRVACSRQSNAPNTDPIQNNLYYTQLINGFCVFDVIILLLRIKIWRGDT